ncbi:hypothetical protein Bca101_067287 [Brassica carinata]
MENQTEEECLRTIQERMFAFGDEPVGVRVTPYHKAFAIRKILRALDEDEIAFLRRSPIKYAFLALLSSVILPTTHTPKISYEHAEKIKDLDAFLAYPWGQVSFDLLVSSIKERNEVSLSQNTIALKGFALALQLVMIEAVPALTGAVHDGGSSGSEGDFADDEELDDEERNGKRSISPGHARDTDCAGKAAVVSIIPVGNDEINGDSYHSFFKGGASKSDVVRIREETRSEAEIRKTSKQKSNSSSADVVDAESFAACVKSRLSGDLNRLSDELNRVGADVSHMGTELNTYVGAFSTLETSILSKVEEMMKTFMANLLKLVSTPVVVSPGPTMQNVPPSEPVNSPIFTNADDGMVETTTCEIGRSKTGDGGLNDDATESAVLRPPGVDLSKIMERAVHFADNVELDGVNQTLACDVYANVCVSEQPHKCTVGEQDSSLDPALLFPKPTFSLGLSQEVGKPSRTPSMKSKRQKVVPKALVGDYECDKRFLTRSWEAHVAGNRTGDDDEADEKYLQLKEILKTPFSFYVNGVKIESKDLYALVEKSGHLPMKVVDVLIHHTRSVYNGASDQLNTNQAVFFDTKFVSQLSKTYGRFSKVIKKESFKFAPTLLENFIGACSSIDSASRFYFPFNLDKTHWVGVCIDVTTGQLEVLDCNVSIRSDVMMSKEMAPIALMFPFLMRQAGKQISTKELKALTIDRPRTVLQLQNQLYLAASAVLLIQAHAFGGLEMTKCISPTVVDSEVERLAVTIVERYHGKI